MPREKADYRDNLELVLKRFGDRALLTQKEVGEFLGLSPYAMQRLPIVKKVNGRYMVSAVALAKYLS